MKKIPIGSIIEFNTARGLAYGQLSHKHEQYSDLIRVYGEFYKVRPDSFEAVIEKPLRFSAFTHLSSALKQGATCIVANLPVPGYLQDFPLFRSSVYDKKTDSNSPWWLWDGIKAWRVDELTSEEWKYPKKGLWNIRLFIDRLEEGWVQEGSKW